MKARKTAVSLGAEEYLEAIFRLERKTGVAKTMALARQLHVVPGSVTNTIENLEKQGFVLHEPYKGVRLTKKGRKIALDVLRRHRLAERLLTDTLHLDWSEVHDMACKLEHGITAEIIKPLEEALGNPQTCPHGNPIPMEDGKVVDEESKPLTDLNPGEGGLVSKITEEERDTLRHLAELGLTPGAIVEIKERPPFDGPLTIWVSGRHRALDQKLAVHIHVKPSKPHGGRTKHD